MKRSAQTLLSTTILSLLLLQTSIAQLDYRVWQPSNGVSVRQSHNLEWLGSAAQRASGDNVGEVAFTWSDCRRGDHDVYLQVFNHWGESVLPEGGLLVAGRERHQTDPVVIAVVGGWVVAWLDFADDTLGGLSAVKLNSAGQFLQGDALHPVTVTSHWQIVLNDEGYIIPRLGLVDDGEGGCYFVWEDLVTGNGDIRASHLLSDGGRDERWPEEGLPLAVSREREQQPVAILSDDSALIAGWVEYTRSSASIQKVSLTGESLWNNGEPLCIYNAGEFRPPKNLRLCSDGDGGAIIGWADDRNVAQSGSDIYTQRVSGDGAILWEQNGALLCGAAGEQKMKGVFVDDAGTAVAVWSDQRDEDWTSDIYAMKFGGERFEKIWQPEDGVVVVRAERDQHFTDCLSDGAGGAFILWDGESELGFPFMEVRAQHLDPDGHQIWMEEGAPVDLTCVSGCGRSFFVDGDLLVLYSAPTEDGRKLSAQGLDDQGQRIHPEPLSIISGYDYGVWDLEVIELFDDSFALIWMDNRCACGAKPYIQICHNGREHPEFWLPPGGAPMTDDNYGGGYTKASTSDGRGGVLIAWSNFTVEQSGVYVQPFSEEGERLWDGRRMVNDDAMVSDPDDITICSDGNEGAFIAWISIEDEWAYMQHIGSDGGRTWENDLRLPIGDGDWCLDELHLTADGEGGALVSVVNNQWFDGRRLIYANRVSSRRILEWGQDGVIVCNEFGDRRNVQTMLLDDGLAFVWSDARMAEDWNDLVGVYFQVVSLDGRTLFEENGVEICSNPNGAADKPVFAVGADGEIWIAWEDWRDDGASGRNIAVQCIRIYLNGHYELEESFDHDGLVVVSAPGEQCEPAIKPDADGGVYLVWEDRRSDWRSDLYGLHLDRNGRLEAGWAENGNIICDVWQTQRSPQMAMLGGEDIEGFAVAWLDERASFPDFVSNIYVQRIDDASRAAPRIRDEEAIPETLEIQAVYPNPFNSTLTIRYSTGGAAEGRLALYDIAGRLVREWSVSGARGRLTFNAEGMAGGLYLARLEAGGSATVRSIVLSK